jgi:hypothetical protein
MEESGLLPLPLYTKLCGLQEEARSFGEGKYFLPVLGIEQ